MGGYRQATAQNVSSSPIPLCLCPYCYCPKLQKTYFLTYHSCGFIFGDFNHHVNTIAVNGISYMALTPLLGVLSGIFVQGHDSTFLLERYTDVKYYFQSFELHEKNSIHLLCIAVAEYISDTVLIAQNLGK